MPSSLLIIDGANLSLAPAINPPKIIAIFVDSILVKIGSKICVFMHNETINAEIIPAKILLEPSR